MYFCKLQIPLTLVTIAAVAILAAGCGSGAAEGTRLASATQSVFVTPDAPNGWTLSGSGGSTAEIAPGPGNPPLGDDSLHLSVDETGATAAQARNTDYAGTRLADLTELSYSTFISSDTTNPELGRPDQAPYIILHVDLDADGDGDTLLFFEPEYSNGNYVAAFDQGELQAGVWQTWDALAGGWWSTTGAAGAGPGTDVKSLAQILEEFPDAEIVNTTSGLGGVRIVAGFGAGAWNSFEGAVDAFAIGVGGDTTVYNFELTTADDCKNGGWQSLGFKNQGQCIKSHLDAGKNP